MTTRTISRRLVLSKDFLAATARLTPKGKQAVSRLLVRLRREAVETFPQRGGSVYERVPLEVDGLGVLMRSADDIVLLLWVGDDESCAFWADHHVTERNGRTGELQVWPIGHEPAEPVRLPEVPDAEEERTEASGGAAPVEAPLFDALSDEELFEVGLPPACLPILRSVGSERAFETLRLSLPESVFEALTWFLQGEDWNSVREAYGSDNRTKTYAESPLGRLDPARFHEVSSDDELRDVLSRPLDEWRVFLHSSQLRLVEKAWRGAVRVTGGAGTGKTVVALHRARHLVRLPDWKPTEKLLLTTFTKNLAVDLEWQLKRLCSREDMRRIQVTNIDAWLASFVRQHGAGKTIVYPGSNRYERIWRQALRDKRPAEFEFSEAFYRSEWEEVILTQHCVAAKDYLFASRAGRGTPLTRAQRKAMWPVFEEMRLRMELEELMTVEDAADFAVGVLHSRYPQGLFRAVVADEIQDFKPDMLRLLRAMTADVTASEEPKEGDLFMVGDAHQRIYNRPVAFNACGIAIRGRSKKLRVNYRTTDEIRRTAESVFRNRTADDMEGGVEEKTGYASMRHGKAPETHWAPTHDDEVRWIVGRIRELVDGGLAANEICVVLRTNDWLERYRSALEAHGVEVRALSRGRADDSDEPGVRIATMHRVKGLEFKAVFVAGMNEGVFPQPMPEGFDAVQKRHHERTERSLFYVSASRASSHLFFSASGKCGAFWPVLSEEDPAD